MEEPKKVYVTEFSMDKKEDWSTAKFYKFNNKAIKPFYSTYLASGLDLCIPEPLVIKPNEVKQVNLGFTLVPPKTHGYSIRPRSSMSAIGLHVNYGTVGKE